MFYFDTGKNRVVKNKYSFNKYNNIEYIKRNYNEY